MLTKIEKIENLGIFSKYTNPDLSWNFERFNVFYGLNGSGKTTLSQLLSFLNDGGSESFEDLKYKINTSEGVYKEKKKYSRKIRVFNTSYIDSNIGELEGKLNPIFIIGEENKALALQIQKDEKKLIDLEDAHQKASSDKRKKEKDRGKFFSDIAKLIAADTSGQVTRNYRKPDAEKAFSSIKSFQLLSKTELELVKQTLRQKFIEPVDPLVFGKIHVKSEVSGEIASPIDGVQKFEKFIKEMCKETAETNVISRLQDHPEIASWVEQGYRIQENEGGNTCEYCLQEVPQARLKALVGHFNQSDLLLKQRLEQSCEDIKLIIGVLGDLQLPAKSEFYDELKKDFHSVIVSYKKIGKVLAKHLSDLLLVLDEKLKRRTESFEASFTPFDEKDFNNAFKDIKHIIEKHNKKSAEFEEHLVKARNDLEVHHLTVIKKDIDAADNDIGKLDTLISSFLDGDAKTKNLGIKDLKEQIAINRLKVANSHKAAERLTALLQAFLGRNDLKFEAEGEGYRIMRHNHAAKRLSEGEKTAITFIYFIVQLRDHDFETSDGIIVIDDPVSSLDSGSVYQAFSFLKDSVKDAKQVILFTHNFDFMKLILNWYKNIPKSEGKKCYRMLLCELDQDGKRHPKIVELDKELLTNQSEYSYLFKQLYNFKSDGTIANSYHIPNIARKVLETFLNFHYNGHESMYKKLEKVSFDSKKKTALLKFANDLSHPTGGHFDPALVPETQKNVHYLLDMIKAVSPVHYESLEESIKSA